MKYPTQHYPQYFHSILKNHSTVLLLLLYNILTLKIHGDYGRD